MLSAFVFDNTQVPTVKTLESYFKVFPDADTYQIRGMCYVRNYEKKRLLFEKTFFRVLNDNPQFENKLLMVFRVDWSVLPEDEIRMQETYLPTMMQVVLDTCKAFRLTCERQIQAPDRKTCMYVLEGDLSFLTTLMGHSVKEQIKIE